jgi:hypothetical protein
MCLIIVFKTYKKYKFQDLNGHLEQLKSGYFRVLCIMHIEVWSSSSVVTSTLREGVIAYL